MNLQSEIEYSNLLRRLRPTEYEALVDRLRRPSWMRRVAMILF